MELSYPLILDGAMGTRLAKAGIPAGVCAEAWMYEHPDVPYEIQRSYADAGSQILYTPTFGANAGSFAKYGLEGRVSDLIPGLVDISRHAASGRALLAGDISSADGLLRPLGDKSFEDLYEIYLEQAAALEKSGVNLFVIETMTNIAEARAALLAVKAVSSRPVFVTFSCGENGRTMMGTDVCAALLILQGMGADAFGLNCSTGPAEMLPQLRRLYRLADIPLIAKPNAGLPQLINGETVFTVDAEKFASFIPAMAEAGAGIFGSCCGSDETFIAAIKKALQNVAVKAPSPEATGLLPCATEKEVLLLEPDTVCTTVLDCSEELEDELCDTEDGDIIGIRIDTEENVSVFAEAQYAVRNPLCIICNDTKLLESALRAYQGRPLYEGDLSEEELLPLVRKYGLII